MKLHQILLLNIIVGLVFMQPANASNNNQDTTKNCETVRNIIIESDFNTKYLWRGINFQDAVTWNPNFTYNYKNFSANAWLNIPIYYYDDENKVMQDFKELDVNLNYEIEQEVSYTMITSSSQFYTPLGKGDWYWGLINVFQGFYLGDIGFYVNPEVNYFPYKGGVFLETGLNYNHENDRSTIAAYLAYSSANKIFTAYNICGDNENAYTNAYQTIKFDVSCQYNIKSIFLRPHFTYYHLLNYSEITGYKNCFSFGLALGLY